MRVFHVQPGSVSETAGLPMLLPARGFLWVACGRREFELEHGHVVRDQSRGVYGVSR